MTIYQKLSWMQQMGIRVLCGEESHPLVQAKPVRSDNTLSVLDKKLAQSKSALSATATHPIGGVGVIPAQIMCVLEMPSASEDKTGEALSGAEGTLLKKMLNAIGLDITKQTYVTYLSPWRSPGARVLTNLETQEGLALLKQRIQVVQPKILLLFGMSVTKALLNIPLGEARSKIHSYDKASVFATFAPSFLIKNNDYRRPAWEDLKKLNAFFKEHK